MAERSQREAVEAFVALARQVAASGAPAGEGEWGIEMILAHVAANSELLLLGTAAAMNGGRRHYTNDAVLDEPTLAAIVRASGGVAALLEEVERSGLAIVERLQSGDPRLDGTIHVKLRDGAEWLVDEDWTCRRLLEANAGIHYRLHARQLKELVRGATVAGSAAPGVRGDEKPAPPSPEAG